MFYLFKFGLLFICVGYFDDRVYNDMEWYVWIFKFFEGFDYDIWIVLFYFFFGNRIYCLFLLQWVVLVEKFCFIVFNIYVVNWLYKGIFLENVFFCFDDGWVVYDFILFIFLGFEFFCFDGMVMMVRDMDIVWDLYWWLGIQWQWFMERNLKKIYDFYFLGLVLLEVVYWEKFYVFMGLGKGRKVKVVEGEEEKGYFIVSLEESKNVRDWFLGVRKEGVLFEMNFLVELGGLVGERYVRVVERCLWVYGERGFGVVDGLLGVDGGLVLQEVFIEGVVEELRGIRF